MTNVWGIHMPEQAGIDAIENGYVAIGWSEMENIFDFPAEREAYKVATANTYPDIKKGAVPVTAGILFRYVHEIQSGDYVVYPSKHDRQVNIGRFTGAVERSSDTDGPGAELPHRHGVEWLGHFPRSDFSQAALYEIGSIITLFSVRNNANEFLAKVDPKVRWPEGVDLEETPDDDRVTSSVSIQAEETTHDYVIKRIYSGLSGYGFEHFTAHVLECMGYTARVSDKSGDGGVDVIAHTDELGFQPPIIKVQCKRITSQTGEPEVNQLLGTLGEGEFALFVNLGSYSRAARLLERNRAKLRLIDGEQLVELVLENYGKMSPRYRTLIPLRQIYVPDIIDGRD
jgi:restriction system protein